MKKNLEKLSLSKLTVSMLENEAQEVRGGTSLASGVNTNYFCDARSAIGLCNTVVSCWRNTNFTC